jgi:hypothetical protein
MVRRRNAIRRNNNQIVTVAQDGDVQGARFDRMVSNARYNESATMVLVKAVTGVDTAAAAFSRVYSFNELAQEDDFIAMASQFQLFRVKAMRFEVFHTYPSSTVPVVMSTFHTDGTQGTSILGQANTVDGPDSKYMDPGAGKQTFYWNGTNSSEKLYQAVSSFVSYGGLRLYSEASGGAAGLPLIRIIVTAQVVFKGRT